MARRPSGGAGPNADAAQVMDRSPEPPVVCGSG